MPKTTSCLPVSEVSTTAHAPCSTVLTVVWHERERTGYGAVLFEEVTRRVEQAARLPRSGSPLMGFEAR